MHHKDMRYDHPAPRHRAPHRTGADIDAWYCSAGKTSCWVAPPTDTPRHTGRLLLSQDVQTTYPTASTTH